MYELYREVISRVPPMNECAKRGKVVAVRVDVNSPLDEEQRILDDYRIQAHAPTLRALSDAGVRVVVLAHQGRPGGDDFTSLDQHARLAERYVGKPVKFIDDNQGPAAREAIKGLEPGEILFLENVRFLADEVIEKVPEEQVNAIIVRKLAPLLDYYVFDGFAVAHRSQPSVVGFPLVVPSCMGGVFEKELRALVRVQEARGEGVVLVAGGAKVPDTIRAVGHLLRHGLVETIATGGLVGFTFAVAKNGFTTPQVRKIVERSGLATSVTRARELLDKYPGRIHVPTDFAVDANGSRMDIDVFSLNSDPFDIGKATLGMYVDVVRGARAVIFSGPLGVIEDEKFSVGTTELMKASLGRYVIIGGGHTILAARKAGIIDKVSHVSTGGRAFIQSVGGEEMPVLQALLKSHEKFWKNKDPKG